MLSLHRRPLPEWQELSSLATPMEAAGKCDRAPLPISTHQACVAVSGLGAILSCPAASRSPFSSSYHHTPLHIILHPSALHQQQLPPPALHSLLSRKPTLTPHSASLTSATRLVIKRAPLSSQPCTGSVAPPSKRLLAVATLSAHVALSTPARKFINARSTKYHHPSTTHQHVFKQDGAEPRRHPQGLQDLSPWPQRSQVYRHWTTCHHCRTCRRCFQVDQAAGQAAQGRPHRTRRLPRR